MRLERLSLTDYRNFAAQQLAFGPRFTVLSGHNGAGKTNVLEALYLLSTLRSFRTSDLGALVRRGEPGARVELTAHDPELDVRTRLSVRLERREGGGTRRTAAVDDKTVRGAAKFYGRLSAVLFTPEDLAVLRGSPTGRRQFLDRVIFARDRTHIGDTSAYDKLLRSRNHVLRQDGGTLADREPLLDTYEAGLAEVGARIWTRRVDVLASLAPVFVDTFARIHGDSLQAGARYESKLGEVPSAQREDTLRSELASRRRADGLRGTTTVGPQRDDLVIELDGERAATFASQGQSRALVLAFKLAELRGARESSGVPPLLLLDDVSSELDEHRSAQLFAALGEEVGQCVLTTTAPHYVRLPEGVERTLVLVEQGVLSDAE